MLQVFSKLYTISIALSVNIAIKISTQGLYRLSNGMKLPFLFTLFKLFYVFYPAEKKADHNA